MNIYFTEGSPLSGFEHTQYSLKIFTLLFIQTVYLAYVHHVKPHSQSLFNNLEFFNEYCLVILGYVMLCFTKIMAGVNDTKALDYWSTYIAIAIIGLMALINLGVMVRITFQKVCLKCKRRKNVQIHKRRLSERSLVKQFSKLFSNKEKSEQKP